VLIPVSMTVFQITDSVLSVIQVALPVINKQPHVLHVVLQIRFKEVSVKNSVWLGSIVFLKYVKSVVQTA